MTLWIRTVVILAEVGVLALASLAVGQIASANAAPHHVRYTITSDAPSRADIYYRDTDPPNWAEYSHNPYLYSPKVEAHTGPGQTWTLDVTLDDPDQWAMVVASSGLNPITPNFRCTLEVDGAVVKTADGPKGALCSLRTW